MKPRVFVDTNLWYPPSVRALILGVALAGIYEIVTSEGVFDELYRHLNVPDRTHLTADQAAQRVDEIRDLLITLDTGSVSSVDGESAFSPIGLSDPDDEHVVAGALDTDADLIVTSNLGDFPAEVLGAVGLDVLSLDELFADGLGRCSADWVQAVRLALQFPPKGVSSARDLGVALFGAGLERSGGLLTSATWQALT